MATSRPFAYNPIPPGSEISGTTQFVNLAIGVLNEQYDEDYGGVKWWEGPDEDLGYIICQPISGNTQPTPISGLTASVGFYRTTAFTDSAFLLLCNKLPARKNQVKFQTTNEATVWLTANGYWTNYIAPTPTPTPTITPTATPTPPELNYYYSTTDSVVCSGGGSGIYYPTLIDCSTATLTNETGVLTSLPPTIWLGPIEGSNIVRFIRIEGPTLEYHRNTNCVSCSTPTPTPTYTPTTTPPCDCVEFVNVEVTTAGIITYLDCSGVSQFQNVGIGPEVIGVATCINKNTLGGTAIFIIDSIGPCCNETTPTQTSTPTLTPTGTSSSVTPTPTPTPTQTPSTCDCVQFVNVEVTTAGIITYLDCDGISQFQNVSIGPEVIGVATCINKNTLGGTAIFTIDSIGPCCNVTTPTPTPTPTSTPAGIQATIEFSFFDSGSGVIRASMEVISGVTLDSLSWGGDGIGYSALGCIGTTNTQSFSDVLGIGGTQVTTEVWGAISAILSANLSTFSVAGNTINTNFQTIVVGGNSYLITGATDCFSPLT
jgi:hypothetical protein